MNQLKDAMGPDDGGASGRPDPSKAPEIWDLALEDLRYKMTPETFHAHLSGSLARDWQPQENAWVIQVRNAHSPQWLRHRLGRVVQQALARHTPGLPEPSLVYFAAAASTAGTQLSASTGPRDGTGAASQEADRAAAGGTGDPARKGRGQRQVPAASQAPSQEARQQESAEWKAALKPTDIYIKLKTSFRDRALRRLKGAKLSVFMSLALHMDADGTSAPGIKRIMRETGHARGTVCRALDELASPPLSLIEKVPASQAKRPRGCIRMPDCYRIRGYAWWGAKPAPALYEEDSM